MNGHVLMRRIKNENTGEYSSTTIRGNIPNLSVTVLVGHYSKIHMLEVRQHGYNLIFLSKGGD